MKDNRLRELEPGYARCVWYVMYQLLPTQLTVFCTKTWANFHHFSFENLTQKMHRLFQTRYSSFAFNWAVLLTNFCYIVLLQMFSIDWALKDISITVQVKTGQIDNVYSREFSVQILPHYTKSLQIQKALELLNYETIRSQVGYILLRPALECFSECIHIENKSLLLFFHLYHYYALLTSTRPSLLKRGNGNMKNMSLSVFHYLHANAV